jgi:hypothetical protein
LPDESSESHAAFVIYRDIGENRSLEIVGQKCGKNVSLLGRWSRKHDWVARARAWDSFLQRARDDVHLAHAVRWEERRMEAVEEAWTTGEAVHKKAMEMLALPLVEKKLDRDGKTTILKPVKWSLGTVVEMLRLANELRLMSTASAIKPLEECDDDELDAIEEANRAAKSAHSRSGRGQGDPEGQ